MIRRLNAQGLVAFREWLSAARVDGSISAPKELLEDPNHTVPVLIEPNLTRVDFDRRFEFGQFLAKEIPHTPSLETDIGLWSWIALRYIDHVCPFVDGRRKVRETERYILDTDYQGRYRHLCRTPWLLVTLHGVSARVALDGALFRHGEAAEQFLSRQQLFTNRALFRALDILYVSESKSDWRIKRGARSKTAGTMRRFGKIMRQYDLTWDLSGMQPEQVLQLLPREFDAFK